MISRLPPSKYDPLMEMRNPDFEMQYVIDDTPPEVALHAHLFYEIYLFCEGDINTYVVGHNSYHLRGGDVLVIPPEVMHHPIFCEGSAQYKRYTLYLSQSYITKLCQIDEELSHVLNRCRESGDYLIRCKQAAHSHALENTLLSIGYTQTENCLCARAERQCRCINFLVELNRADTEHLVINSRIDHHFTLLEQIIAYISENFQNQISLNSTAASFFVSSSTVESLFKQNLGKSFYRYVTEYRILSAQSLILKGVSLKDVSSRCGFSDYSTFFKMFRKEVGVSPSEFRLLAPRNSLS